MVSRCSHIQPLFWCCITSTIPLRQHHDQDHTIHCRVIVINSANHYTSYQSLYQYINKGITNDFHLIGGLEHEFYFSISYMGCHPSQLTNSYVSEGQGSTTNQLQIIFSGKTCQGEFQVRIEALFLDHIPTSKSDRSSCTHKTNPNCTTKSGKSSLFPIFYAGFNGKNHR